MSVLEVTISAKLDGQPLLGGAITRRVTVDEVQQFSTEQATGGGYASLPLTNLDQLDFLLLQPSQQITIRLNAQSDAGLVVNGGGLLLIVDSAIAAAAATNATTSNASGSTALLSGVAGGT